MGETERYRDVIKNLISEHAQFKSPYGDIKNEIVFDEKRDHYELVIVGWNGKMRIHGSVIHIDIIDGKVWLQHDGTDACIVDELERAGIPKDKIVLGFRSPELRKYTGYAVF